MVLHELSSSGSTDNTTGFSTTPPQTRASFDTTPSTSTRCPSCGGFTGALTSVCSVRKYSSPLYSASQHGTVDVSRTIGHATKLRCVSGAADIDALARSATITTEERRG